MYLQDFFNKYNGKAVDKDGAYGPQCMDIYNLYQEEVFGKKAIGAPYARDVWNKDMYNKELFNKIENTLEFVPKLGDVALWDGSSRNIPYGHLSICTGKGDINSFESFDQNFNKPYCEFTTHDYSNGFRGVLRPKEEFQNMLYESEEKVQYTYKVGQLVVYSSCYRGNNDVPPNYIDCIVAYGAWQQRYIKEIVGGRNPYKLDNGLFVNDGDIREVKN